MGEIFYLSKPTLANSFFFTILYNLEFFCVALRVYGCKIFKTIVEKEKEEKKKKKN